MPTSTTPTNGFPSYCQQNQADSFAQFRVFHSAKANTGKQLSFKKQSLPQPIALTTIWLIGLLLVLSHVTHAQVIGRVFRDYNGNGIQDTPISSTAITAGEPGVSGIVVTAYRTIGAPVSATTTLTGSYTFTAAQLPTGTNVRLEFGVLPTGDFSGPFSAVAAGSSTSVQFVTAGAATNTANFGINYPTDYCGTANPLVYTTCFVQNLVPANSANDDVLVGVNYNATGAVAQLATSGQIGAVWGVAHDRNTNKIYTSAFIKRHVGLATNGGPVAERTGAIYVTTPNAVSGTTALFVSLDALGFDTGTDPHGTLPTSSTAPSYDVQSFTAVGKVGLGGIDLSDDGQFLYTINLFDRKLYRIPTTAPTAANVVSYSITNPCGNVGDFRPFAVKFYRGKVYVGVVCSSESNQARATLGQVGNTQLTATVYELTGATFMQVLSFPLSNFLRGQVGADASTTSVNSDRWYPWLPDTDQTRWLAGNNNQYTLPQPILSDIEFDVNGDMIIGLMDRFGHQTGYLNYFPDPAQTNTTLIRAWANGDQLRARRCGAATTFTLESNASLCGGTATAGVGNGQGPGGGEWYYKDDALGGFHEETSNGGLAQLPGSGELIVSTIDPTDNAFSGGIRWYTNNTGAFARGFQLYSQVTPGTFGKAAGIGDTELRCAPAPIEIGNRVWKDDNRNGIQDPDEVGIQNVTVTLYKSNTLIATAVTNSDGEYYFSSDITGTNTAAAIYSLTALTYNTAYTLQITNLGNSTAATGLTLTDVSPLTPGESGTANSGATPINNDAMVVGGRPTIMLTTGGPGSVNHTYDFGLSPCLPPSLTALASSGTACAGSAVTLTAQVSPAGSYTYVVTAPGGVTLSAGASATAIASGLAVGLNTFTITAGSSPTCFTTATVSVSVVAPPVITLTSVTICAGQSVSLTASGAGAGATYVFSTTGSVGNTLTVSPIITGAYTVTGITAGGCSATATATVTVNPLPVATLTQATSVCLGQPLTLTATGGTSYTFSTGLTNTTGLLIFTPASTTTISVTVANASGCRSTTTAIVTVNPLPVITLASATICAGQSVNLTASGAGAGATYVFSTTGSVGNILTVAPTLTAAYTVTATIASGCSATATATVTVNAKPNAGADQTLVCGPLGATPTSVVLTALPLGSAGVYTNLLTNPTSASLSVFGLSTIASNLTVGTYTFVFTATNGCTDTVAVTVPFCQTFCASLSATATASSATVTTGSSVTLSANVSPAASYTYVWSGPGAITPTNAGTVVASSLPSGVNTFTVTVTSSPGCFTTATVSVTVLTPTLALSVTPGICQTATNQYSISGTVSLSAAVPSMLTVSDGISTTDLSVSAGQTSASFSLTGLNSGTGSHTVTVSGIGYTSVSAIYVAPVSCTVAVGLTVTPGVCNTATNQYSISGSLSLTNAIAGNAIITDGTATTTISVSAGTTSVAYSLTGLNSGTGSHTVTVSYVGKSASVAYTAPASCTVAIALSVTDPGTCQTATNGYIVTGSLSLTNAPLGTVTITDGATSTTLAVALGTTSLPYSLSGLNSGTGTHIITVSFADQVASVTYTAPLSCSIAPALAVTVTPGICSTATNGYDLTGTVSLTAAVASTLTISDGTSSTTVAVTAGQTSVDFLLPGQESGTGLHIVTVSGLGYTPVSVTYTAPLSCSIAPALGLSITVGTCSTATNAYTVTGTVSLTAAVASLLTITDGASTTTISVTVGQTPVSFSLIDQSGTGAHIVTVSGLGYTPISATYTAPLSCSVAPALDIAVTPGTCSTATNGYDLTGTVSLTAAVASTLTISDGTSSTTVAVTAGQTSVSFSLSALSSGTGTHIVTVTGLGYSPVSTTYTAPLSCTVNIALTVTPGVCETATNQYSISGTLSLTNALAGTAIITDGSSMTLVSVGAGDTSVPYMLDGLTSDGASHTVTISYAGKTASVTYTAPASCSVAPPCLLSLVITSGDCNTATNEYSVTGFVSATNAIGNQAVMLTDGAVSTTVSLTGNGPASFTLAGLISDGTLHSVAASAATCGLASTTYTAPASCTVCVPFSVSLTSNAPVCQPQELTLTASGGVTYQWSGPNNFTATGSTVIRVAVDPTMSGIYSVTATDANGCTATSTISVTINPLPTYVTSLTCNPDGTYSVTLTTAGEVFTFADAGILSGNVLSGIPAGKNAFVFVSTAAGCEAGGFLTAPICPASLGDFVFEDSNRNGQQDSGEPGIANVSVTLLTSGTVVSTILTDGSGLYSFTGLTPGVPYSVSFTTPANYSATTSNVGANDGLDSDPVGGLTAPVTLTSGENNTTLDAGFYLIPAQLGDFVFEDANHNGQQNTGEPGIPNVSVSLLSSGTLVASTTTDINGLYSFTGLTPGVPYSVSFTAPTGYSATLQDIGSDATDSDGNPATGLTGVYSLTANEFNPTVDMGYFRPASIGDYVFADNNLNGVQDGGDTPIPGVTVTLLDGTNTPIASTTTDVGGLYSFTGLTPGVPYSVSFTTPTGYSATTPLSGTDITVDSNPVGGVTAPVTLTSGENNPTLDAGFTPVLGSIGSIVFVDVNKNGQRDPGDTGIDGITVRLLRETTPGTYTIVSTTVTLGGGLYVFPNLPAGTYVVEFDKTTLPATYAFTILNAPGVPSSLDSDANLVTGRSAPIVLVPGNPAQANILTIDAGVDAGCPPTKCVPLVIRRTR